MNTTLKQGKHDQIGVYERTGAIYEEYRYGSRFRQVYFQIRSESLLRLLASECEAKGRIDVLEIGCGTGITLDYLSKAGLAITLSGIDISQPMLEQAQARFADGDPSLDLRLGSVFELPYEDASFDALYATRFIHQFTQEEKLLIYHEFKRIVRPGGLIIVEFYGNRFHLEKREHARYREKFPDKTDVDTAIRADYDFIPLSFRGGRRLAELFGGWPVRLAVTTLRAIPIRAVVNEYFAVSRSPERQES